MTEPRRRPRVFDADDPFIEPTEDESDRDDGKASPGAGEDADADKPATANEAPRDTADPPAQTMVAAEQSSSWGLASTFITVFFLLSSLAIGLWFTRFISIALARDDWIGWAANGLALILAAIIAIAVMREVIGDCHSVDTGLKRRRINDRFNQLAIHIDGGFVLLQGLAKRFPIHQAAGVGSSHVYSSRNAVNKIEQCSISKNSVESGLWKSQLPFEKIPPEKVVTPPHPAWRGKVRSIRRGEP